MGLFKFFGKTGIVLTDNSSENTFMYHKLNKNNLVVADHAFTITSAW